MTRPPPPWNFSENSSILVASPVPKFILFVNLNYSIHWSVAGCLLQTITSLTNLFSIAVSICQMKKWANCNSHCDQTTLPMRCHALDIYWMVEFLYRSIRTLSIDQRQWKEFIGWVYGESIGLSWFSLHGFHHGILWVGSMQGEQTITRHIWTPGPPHKVWWKLQSLPRISPRIVPTKSFGFFHPEP